MIVSEKKDYKKSDSGWIPESWKDLSIGEVVKFEGGSQPPRNTFVFESKKEYVRLIQIRDYKTDKYKTYIPKALAKKFCTKDDIMIGRYGPPIFQILRGLEGAYNVALIKAIPDKKLTKQYLWYFLKQDKLFMFIDNLSQRSSGQTGVDLLKLKKYPLPLPPIPEQKKIAKILSKVDEKIIVIEQKIEQTQQLKKGFMQRLFTQGIGHTEFKDSKIGTIPKEWEVVKLKQIAKPISKKNRDNKITQVVSVTKYQGIVDSLKYFNKQVYSRDISSYKIIEKNQFAYATIHLDEGSIGRLKDWDEAILSSMYTVFSLDEKKANLKFFEILFKSYKMINVYKRVALGGVNRRKYIYFDIFGNISVPLPSLPEQDKIASILSTLEEKIQILHTKKSCYITLKKGLVQKLLTGQIRVRVDKVQRDE